MSNPIEWGSDMKDRVFTKGNNFIFADTFYYGEKKALDDLIKSWSPGGKIKKTIKMKNVLGFEDFINESVGVITRRYERSHGKKPRGGSHWAFYFDDIGGDPIFAPGRMNYADAVKWAKEEAKKAGKTMVYVGESAVNYDNSIFDIIEPEFNSLKDKLDNLSNKTSNLKWKKALDKIQSDFEKLEFLIGRYDRQLGVIPMDESKQFYTAKDIIKIAKNAGNIVIDAKFDIEDLVTAYGNKVPKKELDRVLINYDLNIKDDTGIIVSESINIKDIGVDTRRYVRSHGKQPRGGSNWAFYFDDKGGDPIFAPGRMNYVDAVKWAKEEAKKAGKGTVYVGESVVKPNKKALVLPDTINDFSGNSINVRSSAIHSTLLEMNDSITEEVNPEFTKPADFMRDAMVFEQFVSERFITIRDVLQWEKDNGKLPIPKRIAQISKDMVKSGFINKDDKLTQAKLWIALEDLSWIEMEKKFGKLVGKFYGGEFYNEMADVMSEKAAYYAYEVSEQIADKVANGEEVEPAYYEMKAYFNAFGMDSDRSRIFDNAVNKLENWMKSNKI